MLEVGHVGILPRWREGCQHWRPGVTKAPVRNLPGCCPPPNHGNGQSSPGAASPTAPGHSFVVRRLRRPQPQPVP